MVQNSCHICSWPFSTQKWQSNQSNYNWLERKRVAAPKAIRETVNDAIMEFTHWWTIIILRRKKSSRFFQLPKFKPFKLPRAMSVRNYKYRFTWFSRDYLRVQRFSRKISKSNSNWIFLCCSKTSIWWRKRFQSYCIDSMRDEVIEQRQAKIIEWRKMNEKINPIPVDFRRSN